MEDCSVQRLSYELNTRGCRRAGVISLVVRGFIFLACGVTFTTIPSFLPHPCILPISWIYAYFPFLTFTADLLDATPGTHTLLLHFPPFFWFSSFLGSSGFCDDLAPSLLILLYVPVPIIFTNTFVASLSFRKLARLFLEFLSWRRNEDVKIETLENSLVIIRFYFSLLYMIFVFNVLVYIVYFSNIIYSLIDT